VVLVAGSALAVLVAVLTSQRLRADAATELFISEYIEGSSNNKAIEIYNGTGTPVDLAAGDYNVQMFFNGNPSATLTVSLTGTVASGDVFVLAQASANAAILAQADQTNGAGWFNGDDAVVLRRGATVVDVVGQIGLDPGTEWGSGLASTADNTLRRVATVCAGDANGTDPFVATAEWIGFATDAVDGLGVHAASCNTVADQTPSVISTFPANGATGVPGTANMTVSFSEPVTVTLAAFGLSCGSGSKTFTLSGGPTSYTLDPTADIAGGETCALTVHAAGVSDADAADPPDTMVADVSARFQTADVCSLPYTPIPAIQGSGPAAAITGPVQTRGVVVGDFELPGGSGQLRGLYVQDPLGDGDAATSDGIFVFTGGVNTAERGDLVMVNGTAGEFQDQTQISAATLLRCGAGNIAPVEVTLPRLAPDDLEPFEGMLVRLPQTLTVTEHFQLGRFGQIVVSSDGRLRQPTDEVDPGPDAAALQLSNNLNRLIIDDDTNIQNPDPIVFGRLGMPLSAANTLRGGDTVTGAVGVMTYTWAGNAASGNAYRVRPVGALGGVVQFAAANPRPAVPLARAGRLRVAGMNLLNFFNTFTGCTNGVGGAITDCRGANSQTEFDRQWPKTVAAIRGTDADVVGVVEIENDGYGPTSAIQFLVSRLNDAAGAGAYAFIDVDAATGQLNALGDDAIKVGLIYKPARATPVGTTAALNTATFVSGGDSGPRNRPSLAQAFAEVGTGSRFVVDVNHFKSKGSACDAPDGGDGQGNCNAVRVAAAEELRAWLAADPTGSGDADVLILGDLNAYRREDPVKALTTSGYINLVPTFHPDSASYAFDGQWGSLDHALASATLRPQVVDARDWAINADEPAVLDYNTDFKSAGQLASLYAADAFRMADHNPVIVDLNLSVAPMRCDVDGDADIDQADLVAIRNANRQNASSATDPRDGNGDGVINVADVRYCQLQQVGALVR
jgi:predicted extracellular nuclease